MIKKELAEILKKAWGDDVFLDYPVNNQFGDLATNFAILHKEKSANDLVGLIPKIDWLEKIEIAGAGFINFMIKPAKLIEEIDREIEKVEKTMVIDYSAPNIAKPFGIGHLRSTNIGQAIYNLYQYLGWNCVGVNHLGDWGTQFGKLIVAIKKWGDKNLAEMTVEDLEKIYVRFHQEAETDLELEEQGRDWFAKLENGDAEAREIWQKCIEISLKEFDKVYEKLGVKIDYALGESFYTDKIPAMIEELKNKGLVTESQGAKIIEFEKMPPAMVIKSNGTTTYFTRDMATLKYRVERWQPDLLIYEVGSDQELHFKQVFATAKMLGIETKTVHVAHGMIRWKDGKFSTRSGKTIHLDEVIEKAKEEARKIAPENNEEKIEAVAIGAIKFSDLSADPKKDIVFDWEKVMSMEGSSGPYLQYTYARCMSVLEKIKEPINLNFGDLNLEEKNLLIELIKFNEKVVEAAERFNPAVMAEYLLSIARKYNEFYAKHRIVGETSEQWRGWLTQKTAEKLKTGLTLLGIKPVLEM